MSQLRAPAFDRTVPGLTSWKRTWLTGIVTLAMAFVALTVCVLVPPQLRETAQAAIVQYVKLDSKNARGYPGWANSDDSQMAITLSITMFNVTNPDAVLGGAMPAVSALGPIVLQEHVQRLRPTWETPQRDVVEYDPWLYYTEQDDGLDAPGNSTAAWSRPLASTASTLLDDTTVTTVYPAFLLAAVNGMSSIADALHLNSLWTQRTPRELLFGYADPLLAAIKVAQQQQQQQRTTGRAGAVSGTNTTMCAFYGGLLGNMTAPPGTASSSSSSSCPSVVPAGGRERMYTGAVTLAQAHSMLSYGGVDSLVCCFFGPCTAASGAAGGGDLSLRPAWGSPVANTIRGSSGLQFPPGVLQPGSTVRIWAPLIRRSLELVNLGGQAVAYGPLTALRFTISNATVSRAAVYRPNADYYSFGFSDALFNVTNCAGNTPTFFSKPIFLDASDDLRSAVAGLPEPNALLHDTWYDVDPVTGVVLGFRSRIQMNVYLSPDLQATGFLQHRRQAPAANGTSSAPVGVHDGPFFPQLSSVYLPVMWMDRSGQMSAEGITALHESVHSLQATPRNVEIGFAVASGLLAVVGLAILERSRRLLKRRTQEGQEVSFGDIMGASAAVRALQAVWTRSRFGVANTTGRPYAIPSPTDDLDGGGGHMHRYEPDTGIALAQPPPNRRWWQRGSSGALSRSFLAPYGAGVPAYTPLQLPNERSCGGDSYEDGHDVGYGAPTFVVRSVLQVAPPLSQQTVQQQPFAAAPAAPALPTTVAIAMPRPAVAVPTVVTAPAPSAAMPIVPRPVHAEAVAPAAPPAAAAAPPITATSPAVGRATAFRTVSPSPRLATMPFSSWTTTAVALPGGSTHASPPQVSPLGVHDATAVAAPAVKPRRHSDDGAHAAFTRPVAHRAAL